jgi:phosphatidylserine/phosphatidylglycerophosphate/cardiolipin synthase-like enzyme
MRILKQNAQDSFRVKAYAGTNGVLLAFDLDETRKPGLLGFAVEKKEGNYPWQWLLNSLTFPGQVHTIPKWNATPSDLAPIQKFRWSDYSIAPGTECKYRVHLAYAGQNPASPPVLDELLEVEIKTDDGLPADHRVLFNRAVAASQAFERKFPDIDALIRDAQSKKESLPIEKWPAPPRDWLENGLLSGIINFIKRAKDDRWALDVAIYEYELEAIVDAVNKAHKDGVEVRVIYHAKKGDEQTALNEANLSKIPKSKKRGRVTSKIFHDKFIVLSKIMSDGMREPKAVLCGSTNFTENGVYRQANVVHVTDDTSIARHYLDLFEVIWNDPEKVKTAKKWIDDNNSIDSALKIFAGFSPRSGEVDLDEFIDIINRADKDLLFATAFKLPTNILDALLGKPHDDVLRFGIQNTASTITGYHADRTADFTAPALLSKGLEGWVKEGLKGQRGSLLVHAKVIVANFTTDSPTVISGSHNYSVPASSGNDENYLIMRGYTDLADRYGLEVLRFYEHYRFRYYAKLLKFKKADPLSVDDSWAKDYYTPGNLKEAARLRFAGR